MLAILLLLGCPAESLGIPVSKSGVEAVSMDDLVRDVAKLSGPPADRPAFLAERWRQMNLVVDADGCARREGSGPDFVAIVAEEGDGAAGAAAVAVAISLAKTLDGRPTDPVGVRFCVGKAPAGARRIIELGRLGEAEAVMRTREQDPSLSVDVDVREPGGTATGDLDYRRLEASTRALVPVMTAWISTTTEARKH